MDTNYRVNIAKWLPFPGTILEKWFTDLATLVHSMDMLAEYMALIIEDVVKSQFTDLSTQNNRRRSCSHDNPLIYEKLISDLEHLLATYTTLINEKPNIDHPIYKYKRNCLTIILRRKLNVVARFIRDLIHESVDCTSEDSLRIIFKLVNAYNALLDLDHDVSEASVNVHHNDCPNMLDTLKKISVTRILQLLAKNRAEESCHELMDCLLTNYENHEKDDHPAPLTIDADISENSSVEIYRALTRHLTPPIANNVPVTEIESSHVERMKALVNTQNEQVLRLLKIVQEISPKLFGSDALKIIKGETRLRESAIRKVKDYYQQVAWGALSSILDHVVLWWSPEALASRHCHGARHLKDWLRHFVQGNHVPPTVKPALQNLCDALRCHVAVTSWDQLFRLAYTSAFECQSKPSSTEGTDTGLMFIELFQLLVSLSNECETRDEWVIGVPLMELPISEQIIILHRMDHSVHMMRLWAMQEAKMIAHTWDLNVFFLLVKGDILRCIEELSYLKFSDQVSTLSMESASVQVYVCAKMRAKIASEVNANIQLLRAAPAKCIEILAKICRVVSLANLHMCFPCSNYWRNNDDVVPVIASHYVGTYFDKVLLPVLEVIEDHETSNMILRIMCEAWLDYIYLHRIKFSEYGAVQLLTDFAYVTTWVMECPIISQNVRNHLLKNEVLRRCEGVGKLLLRHPGEAIAMHNKLPQRTKSNGSPESPGLERMPAEMYVPNQEQWLELRAPKKYNFCCNK